MSDGSASQADGPRGAYLAIGGRRSTYVTSQKGSPAVGGVGSAVMAWTGGILVGGRSVSQGLRMNDDDQWSSVWGRYSFYARLLLVTVANALFVVGASLVVWAVNEWLRPLELARAERLAMSVLQFLFAAVTVGVVSIYVLADASKMFREGLERLLTPWRAQVERNMHDDRDAEEDNGD